jgi:hypothetical protein
MEVNLHSLLVSAKVAKFHVPASFKLKEEVTTVFFVWKVGRSPKHYEHGSEGKNFHQLTRYQE